MTIHSLPQRSQRLLVPLLVAMAAVGCEHSARNLSLDEAKAHEACTATLEAWKSAKQPGDLKPDIIASDYVWASGKKLVAFEFLPGEKSDGTNLQIPVELTLQDAKGAESKSKAVYTVGTSPVVTVIRD